MLHTAFTLFLAWYAIGTSFWALRYVHGDYDWLFSKKDRLIRGIVDVLLWPASMWEAIR